MTAPPRILVAGIGNIFLGDDAFGVHVARLLMGRSLPPNVRVVDFGIRGLDLVYALSEDCGAAILIDAVPQGQPPGTLYIIKPEVSERDLGSASIDAHSMDPMKVLALAGSMGCKLDSVLLVGCEPTPFDPESDIAGELSPEVSAAIEPAVQMVESLLSQLSEKTLTMEASCIGKPLTV